MTVAAVGAELKRAEQPALPITPDQLAADAVACREAGACIYHLHVRDSDGEPTMDVEAFRAALDAIRDATDLIVQFTTGGAVGDDDDSRVAPLSLGPEMASLTSGSVNFGEEVFANPRPLIERLYREMRAHGVLPEFEIFEPGMIATATKLFERLGGDHHLHFDFVLGVPGAMPAWPDAVAFLATHLPSGSTWSATGIGRHFLDVAREAIRLEGHVRTGLEDVLHIAPGTKAPSNAALIELVVQAGSDAGRRPATPDEARDLLGLGRARGTLRT